MCTQLQDLPLLQPQGCSVHQLHGASRQPWEQMGLGITVIGLLQWVSKSPGWKTCHKPLPWTRYKEQHPRLQLVPSRKVSQVLKTPKSKGSLQSAAEQNFSSQMASKKTSKIIRKLRHGKAGYGSTQEGRKRRRQSRRYSVIYCTVFQLKYKGIISIHQNCIVTV